MLKCRTLTGPEKLKLFSSINIAETFPEMPQSDKIQALWQQLLEINRSLSVRPQDVTPTPFKSFEDKAKDFVRAFVEIYPSRHVTPYMHCMMAHVGEFFTTHGALLPFTQQGLEKYDDTITKDFF